MASVDLYTLRQKHEKTVIPAVFSEVDRVQKSRFEGRGSRKRIGFQTLDQGFQPGGGLGFEQIANGAEKRSRRDETHPIYHVFRQHGNFFQCLRRQGKPERTGQKNRPDLLRRDPGATK